MKIVSKLGPYAIPFGLLLSVPFADYAMERSELRQIERVQGKNAALAHAGMIEENAGKNSLLKIFVYPHVKAARDYRGE